MDKSELKILLVDDSKVMRRIISSFLKKMGYCNVAEAACVKQALEVMEYGVIDLIFSDFSMPGMTGLDFLKIVRKDPNTSHIPFVMITAEAQLCHIISTFRAKADDYITKPFTQNFLEYIIKKTTKLHLSVDR
jgi:two-component system, chemotaxis family, chemotaxis protein CheY